MANGWGKSGNSDRFDFLGLQITVDSDSSHKIKTLAPWKESYDKPRWLIKMQRHHFANQCPSSQNYGFSSSHLWMWELDHEEGWAPDNWCFWTVVLEKTLESPLDCREIKSVHLKGNQAWIFTGRIVAEAPIFCHLMRRANSLEKSLILGKIEGRKYWGLQRMKWLDSIIDLMDMSLSKHREIVKDREAWHASVHGITKIWTWLNDWTTTTNN